MIHEARFDCHFRCIKFVCLGTFWSTKHSLTSNWGFQSKIYLVFRKEPTNAIEKYTLSLCNARIVGNFATHYLPLFCKICFTVLSRELRNSIFIWSFTVLLIFPNGLIICTSKFIFLYWFILQYNCNKNIIGQVTII